MNYLLDTHIVLWFLLDDKKLSENVKQKIINSNNNKFISIASTWELAIKINLGKINFDGGISVFFEEINKIGFELLPISPEYITRLENLPLHHRDPFDRLIISTAIEENMVLITADSNMGLYDVSCLKMDE